MKKRRSWSLPALRCMLSRRAQITLGETFVILGAGILGQIAVQLAKMDGARQVIVVDLAESRLALAPLQRI